jgi:hypothetical protein
MGVIFQRIHIREVGLPIPDADQNFVILNKLGLDLLRAVAYGDGYIIEGQHICNFLTPSDTDSPNPGIRTFDEQYIKGSFFLNGQIIFKGSHVLVGIFSFDVCKNGFVWGHDFRNKGIAL